MSFITHSLETHIGASAELNAIFNSLSSMLTKAKIYVKSLSSTDRAALKKDATKMANALHNVDFTKLDIDATIKSFEKLLGSVFHLAPEVALIAANGVALIAKNPGFVFESKADQHLIFENILKKTKYHDLFVGSIGADTNQPGLSPHQVRALLVLIGDGLTIILGLVLAIATTCAGGAGATVITLGTAAPVTITTTGVAVAVEVIIAIIAAIVAIISCVDSW